jgi:UDP-glucuronate 4-epimerase
VIRVLDRAPQANPGFDKSNPDPATSWAPWRIFNIGNHRPVQLMSYVETLEKALNKKANINFLPMQEGDAAATNADISHIAAETGFSPSTEIEVGVQKFVDWYLSYSAKHAI